VRNAADKKTWLYATLACAFGLVAALIFLEIAFRFLPVRESLQTQPVTRDEPYLHFKPNNRVMFSMGWNFSIVNKVRVNNYGFVNDQDYDPGATSPLMAVLGDSYVEAAHVAYPETLQGRLAAAVAGRGRVYSFASSGSALSQYLAYAQFARDRFRPAALTVVVIANDFDESLMEYSSDPGFHYLRQTPSGSYSLELVPFEPSLAHRLFRRSALVRYVHGNGFIDAARRRLRAAVSGEETRFVGNVAAEVDAARLKKSQDAIDYFLTTLPRYSGVPPDRIVLLVDGERPQLYDAQQLKAAQTSYFSQMRSYLVTHARPLGYNVVDLQPRFVARHARDGMRFEWPIDAHWNAAGHDEAAKAVIDTGILARVFGSGSQHGRLEAGKALR
jgi:hypothetical protein